MLFITFKTIDIIDIALVAFLFYQFYNLIKGTVAINIFFTIAVIYLIWLVVKALNMQLLSSIIGQIIGVGIIALIIVFQQEIRRFLLTIGTRYMSKKFSLRNLFTIDSKDEHSIKVKELTRAVINLSKNKTGALIVVARESALELYAEMGEIINANCTARLIESIFFKNNPLHDGALIIIKDKIFAAKCVLPISDNKDIPQHFGMRHRAALGMSERNDSLIVIVSEETGKVSVAEYGELISEISLKDFMLKLSNIQKRTH